MNFIISFILVILFIRYFSEVLKKKPTILYISAAVIAAVVVAVHALGYHFSGVFGNYIEPLFARAGISGAMFILVMYAGAAPAGSYVSRKLMPIRGQLSIIASILTLGHNAAYGLTYFKNLFTSRADMPIYQLLASICSIIMIVIMIPLFITSFIKIRRTMNGKKWKKLQRLAYVFYGLTYVHVVLLIMPQVLRQRTWYIVSFILYTAIYLGYLVCRLLKANARKHKTEKALFKKQVYALIICTCISVASGLVLSLGFGQTRARSTRTTTNIKTSSENTSENSSAETTEIIKSDDDISSNNDNGQDIAENVAGGTAAGTDVNVETASSNTAVNASLTDSKNSSADDKSDATAVSSTVYKDGTFTGTGFGYEGNISVNVTIENDKLVGLEFAEYDDDPDYRVDGNEMLANIYTAQTGDEIVTDVDTVSGATFTSEGVLDAFLDALDAAMN